jgi:hypothetical protein
MATVTQRIGGQLVETDDTNTAQLAQLAGVPVTPSTPAGVAGVGANADQAKMAGTPAQKKPIFEQQTKPQDTLQTAERTETPRSQATSPESQAQQKASQLKSLGSLHTRVEALIAQDLKSMTAATGELAQPQMQALRPEVRTQAETLLQKVIQNPQDVTALAEATQFWKENGLGTVEGFSPEQFVATAQQTLGTQAASQVRDDVFLQNLSLSDAEKTSLDETFGTGNWEGLTVPQLSQKIEDLRQQEFNRVNALRAEMQSATGPRRAQLVQELAELGQTGVTGAEADVKELASQVNEADTVTIGGQQYEVAELLKDQQISDLVTRMLADPKLLGEVAKSNPEFAKWVTDNKAGLDKLAQDVAASQGKVRDTWKQKQALAKVGGVELSDAVMRSIIPDWDKVTSGVPDASTSGIINLMKDPQVDARKKAALASALERSTTDPDLMQQLAKLDAKSLGYAFDVAQMIEDDRTGLLTQLTGVDATTDFILDEKKQKEMAKYRAITDSLTQHAATAKDKGTYNIAMQDPAMVDLIKSGEFDSNDAKLLAARPERFEQYKQYAEVSAKFKAAKDIDSALDVLFGRDVDVSVINDEYKKARRMLALDPGDKAAKAKLDSYTQLDSNADGKLDKQDLASIVEMGLADLRPNNLKDGKPVDLTAVLAGGSSFDGPAWGDKTQAHSATLKNSVYLDSLESLLKDKKLTIDELFRLASRSESDAAMVQKLLGNEELLAKYNFDTEAYGQYVTGQKEARTARTVVEALYGVGFKSGDIKSVAEQAYKLGYSKDKDKIQAAIDWADKQYRIATDEDAKAYYRKVRDAMREGNEAGAWTRGQEDAQKQAEAGLLAQRDKEEKERLKTEQRLMAAWDKDIRLPSTKPKNTSTEDWESFLARHEDAKKKYLSGEWSLQDASGYIYWRREPKGNK